jgi:RHS repeat-associated protein
MKVINLNLNDWYDYGARFYDPQIGRWSVPDVLGEIRFQESLYCYVGNNPVSRIDPDGRYWKDDKDERKADRIAKRIEKANDKLVQKMGRVDNQIAKATSKGDTKKVESLSNQKTDLTSRVETNTKTLTTIGAVGADPNNVFRFDNNSTTYQQGTKTVSAYTMARDVDGTYVINTAANIGNQAHEITHASQITRGGFYIYNTAGDARIPSNSKATFGSMEVEAYKSEFSASGSVPFKASLLENITYEAIKAAFPLTYK